MLLKYKYISVGIADLNEKHGGRPVYYVTNNKSKIGMAQIFFYAPWRRWCVRFNPDTVWSPDCLADVMAAMEEIEKP